MILTVIIFLLVLSVLVLVHEFGHFVVGRLAGIGVLEFALGLPFTKPLWSKTLKGGMKVSLYPVLFGGFVRLLGEESDEKSKNSFSQKNVWARIAVVVAGVTMNLVLAVALFYAFLISSGFKVLVPRLADYNFASPSHQYVVITYVQPNSPAQTAKINPGDVLLAADGKNFSSLTDFQKYTKTQAGKPVALRLTDENFGASRVVTITPRISPPFGQGPMGVGIDEAVELSFASPTQKIFSGLSYSWDMLAYNIKVLVHLGSVSVQEKNIAPLSENVSGPVGIAGAVGTIIGLGGTAAVTTMLNFVGLLSLSLAFMNILPIPALDGGRLAFLLVEAVSGKKLSAKKENLINQIGMFLLLGLIFLISFNDVKKFLVR
ncbi:MAG: M50 family metallopeptidase [Patescibacteria group bacterium]|nr:M50 family metallopeptidase [Patescibacteria group bacterium]MCL5432180.1 M50 family metallopeptidase [Patescibacteria group bacterium]